MWNMFRNCRKACDWRYVKELVPIQRDHNLMFGSLIHECLEKWHTCRDITQVLEHIDRSLACRAQDESQMADWHLATAMMKSYAKRYETEEFEVVFLEKTFAGKIKNPVTRFASRTFELAGKVDGVVRMKDGYYLLEHKTASQIDGDYLEKLWSDFQITLYAHYIKQTQGIKITGIIYNVLVKARLQQGKGENEREFESRKADLLAKSKTGKTTATRKEPEPDDDFQNRLLAKFDEPGMFHREMLYISRDQYDALEADLWELTQQFLDCRRRGVYYRNTAFCFNYHRPCAYFALCKSGDSQNVIDCFYEKAPAHEELLGDPVTSESVSAAMAAF